MKKTYSITITDNVNYTIDAVDENEAIEIALAYWDERYPDILVENETIKELEEEEEE